MMRRIGKIWAKITDPSQSIIDPTIRFRARIVTITILILLATTSLSIMAHSDLSPFTLLLLMVGYLLSRTRYYSLSAYLVVANISFFVVVALFDEITYTREIVFMTIAWFTPSLILAGLIFSIREMVLVSLVHLMVPLLLPVLIPELAFQNIFVGAGYVLVVTAMIIVTMFLRELLEKEKQRELARLNEDLEDRVLERTAQLEAFSYNVSHDLRAPLRAVRGFSEILSMEYAHNLDQDGQMYLDRITASSQKMDHLIDDMLMLSRLRRKEMEIQSFNLGTLAEMIFGELVGAEEAPEQYRFTYEECPTISADKQLVTILLTNLISNAIKFSRECRPAQIHFGCRQNRRHLEFFLQDNGIGFDPQLAEHALRPFQRLHPDDAYEGTGIGLAIVNNIIQRHGGKIRIESQPGEGTTVFFSLQASAYRPK